MKSSEWLSQLSQLIQLPYYQRAIFEDKAGTLIGVKDGYLVVVGLGKIDNTRAVKLILRHGEADPKATLNALKAAPDSFARITADQTATVALKVYSFSRPSPEDIAKAVMSMLTVLKTVAPPMAGRCEHCKREENQITLHNNIPSYVCGNCQQKIQQDLQVASQSYDEIQSNFPRGLLFGAAVALAGGVLWGVVAYMVNRIFLLGAIGIGALVGKATVYGMRKVTWPGRLTIGALTVCSVLFGDLLFYTLTVMQEQGIPFSTDLVMALVESFWEIEGSDGAISAIFGLIGAGLMIVTTRKPAFQAVFEPLGAPNPVIG
jgi:hypothetical protein